MAKSKPGKKAMTLQSALEYLSTYGWAILVIAIVFFAMFELGVFNQYALAPKVTAGSCSVYRPDGPGTLSHLSLSGSCNSGLPKFVASFNGSLSYVNVLAGTSSGNIKSPFANGAITVAFWFYPKSSTTQSSLFAIGTTGSSDCFGSFMEIYSGAVYAIVQKLNTGSTSENLSGLTADNWHFAALTFQNSGSLVEYLDGKNTSTAVITTLDPTNQIYNLVLGTNYKSANSGGASCGGGPYPLNGEMADVQIYNASLSPSDISAMYHEGIGGDPINLKNLVGWWPLNGDVNDYSGNGNNGFQSNVSFSTTWYGAYASPSST